MPRRAIAILSLCLLAHAGRGDGHVTLRPGARVQGPAPITLEQIADLDGPEALAISSTIVLPAVPAGRTTITLERVRAALEQRGDVHWGRLTLSGGACELLITPAPTAPIAPPVRVPDKPAPERFPAPAPVQTDGPETLRTRIAARLAEQFGVPVEELRLRLNPNGTAPTTWADEPIDDACTYEIRPVSALNGSRMALQVERFRAGKHELTRPVMADVQVHRLIVSATRTLARDEPIAQGDLSVTEQWVSPSLVASSTPHELIGAVPRRKIDAGKPVSAADVQMPLVVSRGDTVQVDVPAGGLSVRARTRALGPARLGESVKLQMDASKKVLYATVTGPGQAVIGAPPASEPEPPRSTR